MNTFRHIRRQLPDGKTVPPVVSWYQQIVGIQGGTLHEIPEPRLRPGER
jgi:hypothetical protein